MKSMKDVTPMLLIGIDNAKLTAHHEVLESNDGPLATRTKLGWAVGGGGESNGTVTTCHVQTIDERSTNDMIEQFFSTEQFGVRVNENAYSSKDDVRALNILEETSKRVSDNKWEVGLLWKSESPKLPQSQENALARLKMQERKMDRNPDFAKEYCLKIQEYEDKGYIRKLNSDEAAVLTPKTWILPHFGVLNPNKPGKLRLVYDVAAKSRGVSLNSELLTGPDFQNNLQAVLWRFRERPIAFTADITDMFHRVLIKDEDLHAQRFLWRGMERIKDPDTYQMNVMIFGATSSPSTAIYIKNKTALENQMEFPEAAEEIMNNFYMDDYLGCSWDEEGAGRLIPEVIGINEKADYTLCKFLANSATVLQKIPENLRASGVKSLDEKSELPIERVLGLWWNSEEDTFTFKVNYHKVPEQIVKCEKVPTKREMSRLVMSMYDPIGFIAPFKIKGLILLQSAWRDKIDWDEQISAPLNEQWMEWANEIHKVTQVRVPRCYAPGLNRSQNQLHIFMDASEEAFDAAAYIRAKHQNGRVDVSLISAKVRVAPLKHVTIPRLELQAALMGSRLAESIRKESRLEFENYVYWSDSKTVLGWLRSTSGRFDRFVSNRVGEILQTSEVEQWRWIPSALNVADDATRKSKPCDFNPTGRWFTGAEFLKKSDDYWPVEVVDTPMEFQNEEVEQCSQVNLDQTRDVTIPFPNRFSSWTRLVRATAAVITAAKIWKDKCRFGKTNEKMNFYSVDTLQQSEKAIWKKVQLDSFQKEYLCLLNEKPLPKDSRILKLYPILDDENLIRMKGRIQNIHGASYVFKDYQPVILDPKHPITKLIIDNAHLEGAHCGQERAVSSLREKFWILDIRTAVRSAWNRCQDCANRRANPVKPEMGNLPPCRLQINKPTFSSTGVDYFGPMSVTIGRRHEKRWGVLFTCLTTRAIHLELSPSLDTDQMIMSLMRFINRRGTPENMHSDNGTNFVGANEELKRCLEIMNHSTIHNKLASQGIKWHFIPPAAPHMGGSWERLIQTVKKTLNRVLKEQSPKEYTLLTLLTEVENIVNGRPLTHASNDPEDPECLTPNHFLRPATFMGPSLAAVFEDSDLLLRKQWRIAQRMADHFWARWVKEYLPSIQKREKWNLHAIPLQIGDVVILVDDLMPRNSWKKGIITAVFPGKDGVIRVVEVKTAHGVYRRPVTKVCPLRLRICDDGDPSSGGRNVAGTTVV